MSIASENSARLFTSKKSVSITSKLLGELFRQRISQDLNQQRLNALASFLLLFNKTCVNYFSSIFQMDN